MNQHELYEPKDFTNEEYQRRNVLAVMVIDGGLGVCKRCGATEIELETWVTCQAYRAHMKTKHAAVVERCASLPNRGDQSGWQP